MPPSQTNCTIPAEVKTAAGGFMMASLYAYGPERNFAYPPRPANPRLAWNPDWTAKVRFRAMTSLMLGMPGMDGSEMGEESEDGGQPQPKPKRCRPGLGSILGFAKADYSGAMGPRTTFELLARWLWRGALLLGLAVAAAPASAAPADQIALRTCILRVEPRRVARTLLRTPERFDCTTPQRDFGAGDFWLISQPLNVSAVESRYVLRMASV
eukprot:gene5585-7573_t